jgi:hypothetical protein
MSPRIGVVVDLSRLDPGRARAPACLRAAAALCEDRGMRVTRGTDNRVVGRHTVTGRWTYEAGFHPRALGPIAAACVALQPAARPDATVEEAAAVALEASPTWTLGVSDGFEGDVTDAALAAADRAVYLDGLREGHLLFAELHRRCSLCSGWRYHRARACDGCLRDQNGR